MRVVSTNVILDLCDQLFDAVECASSDCSLRNDIEPDFDLIKPRSRSWRVVNVPAWMKGKPSLHLWMLVSGIIVNHFMYFQILRNIFIYVFEKAEIFLMTMPGLTFGDDLSTGNVECGKKGSRAVSLIVMGNTLDISQTHWQHRLRPVQGLNLALFIHSQDNCLVGRVQVKPDDITDFFNKEWIGGKLEMPLSVRLKPKRKPDAADGRIRDVPLYLSSKSTNRPLSTIFGFGGEGFSYNESHFFISNTARLSGTKLLMQPLDTEFQIACSPFAHRRFSDV